MVVTLFKPLLDCIHLFCVFHWSPCAAFKVSRLAAATLLSQEEWLVLLERLRQRLTEEDYISGKPPHIQRI